MIRPNQITYTQHHLPTFQMKKKNDSLDGVVDDQQEWGETRAITQFLNIVAIVDDVGIKGWCLITNNNQIWDIMLIPMSTTTTQDTSSIKDVYDLIGDLDQPTYEVQQGQSSTIATHESLSFANLLSPPC